MLAFNPAFRRQKWPPGHCKFEASPEDRGKQNSKIKKKIKKKRREERERKGKRDLELPLEEQYHLGCWEQYSKVDSCGGGGKIGVSAPVGTPEALFLELPYHHACSWIKHHHKEMVSWSAILGMGGMKNG